MTQMEPSIYAREPDGSYRAKREPDILAAGVECESVRMPSGDSSALGAATIVGQRAVDSDRRVAADLRRQGQTKFSSDCPQWRSCFEDAGTTPRDSRLTGNA